MRPGSKRSDRGRPFRTCGCRHKRPNTGNPEEDSTSSSENFIVRQSDAVQEVGGGESLAAFELEFEEFERGVVAAGGIEALLGGVERAGGRAGLETPGLRVRAGCSTRTLPHVEELAAEGS